MNYHLSVRNSKKIIALALLLVIVIASVIWFYQRPIDFQTGFLGLFGFFFGVIWGAIISSWYVSLLAIILVILIIVKYL